MNLDLIVNSKNELANLANQIKIMIDKIKDGQSEKKRWPWRVKILKKQEEFLR